MIYIWRIFRVQLTRRTTRKMKIPSNSGKAKVCLQFRFQKSVCYDEFYEVLNREELPIKNPVKFWRTRQSRFNLTNFLSGWITMNFQENSRQILDKSLTFRYDSRTRINLTRFFSFEKPRRIATINPVKFWRSCWNIFEVASIWRVFSIVDSRQTRRIARKKNPVEFR